MTEVMRGMARALCLAAAPVFVVMAVLTVVTAGPMDMMCASHGSWIGGMAPMYALMSLVHAAPWLRLLSGPPR